MRRYTLIYSPGDVDQDLRTISPGVKLHWRLTDGGLNARHVLRGVCADQCGTSKVTKLIRLSPFTAVYKAPLRYMYNI